MSSSETLALPHQRRGVALDQQFALEVERGKRFVKQQHIGLVNKRAGQRHPLTHSTR